MFGRVLELQGVYDAVYSHTGVSGQSEVQWYHDSRGNYRFIPTIDEFTQGIQQIEKCLDSENPEFNGPQHKLFRR